MIAAARTSPRHLLRSIAALAFAFSCAGGAQSFTGRWAAVDKVLDNGEPHRLLLELRQDGSTLHATLNTKGYVNVLSGKVTGTHFEVFKAGSAGDRLNGIVGDRAGNTLHVLFWDRDNVVMKPATPADEIPTPAYIAPPALHTVPSNGLARTPPMGWNSWNRFNHTIDDATVRQIADAMVSSGMRDAGYVYLNIDDTWEGQRDAHGVLQPNRKFPDMKALADYVHSRGLKLGIYSSPGPATCGGYPGSYGHEAQDAKTWAAWGIDYLKYDWCSAGRIYKDQDLRAVYQKMGDALHASGRPIVYSLCEYGVGGVQHWGALVGGNLWRTTSDIHDLWSSMAQIGFAQAPLAPAAGPGHWNDPDMLEIGNGHMTADEYRTHMSLWSLLAAPLLAGNDIRSMSAETKSILLNREVIAIDQDALGREATKLSSANNIEIWSRPLADGGTAVGAFNRGDSAALATIHAADLHLPGAAKARDLWAHRDLPGGGSWTATVPPHGVFLLRISSPTQRHKS